MEDTVQTFLPYADYKQTAQALDYRRLGKQRVEAMQILRILLNETDRKGWRTHPAVLMWKGYEIPSTLEYIWTHQDATLVQMHFS